LVTKDKKPGKKVKAAGLKVTFVNESEAVAVEALRQLALTRFQLVSFVAIENLRFSPPYPSDR
jgi:hypothetical protein